MNNQNRKCITSLSSGGTLLRTLFLYLMIFSLLLLTPGGVQASSLSKPLHSLNYVVNMSPAGGSSNTLTVGNDFTVYVEVYKNGVTNEGGQGADIDCTLHWAPVTAFGGTWGSSTDTPMTYNADINNNDRYMTTVTPAAGLYELTASCTDQSDLSTLWQGAGNIRLTVNAALPSVTTSDTTGVTTSDATLNGVVNANGNSTSAVFEYGLSTSYGTTVPAYENPVTGTNPVAVSYTLTGLSPNTTYHYRAVATNSAGTIYGAALTFTTGCLSAIDVTNANTSGAGSLSQAIQGICAGGIITFMDHLTIPVGQLIPPTILTLNANGYAVTLQGGLTIDNEICVVLEGVNLMGSGTSGTAFGIINRGILTLNDLTVSNYYLPLDDQSDDPGAIKNSGSLTIHRSVFKNNTGGHGGAIYNTGLLIIRQSTFMNNVATMLPGGGAIYNLTLARLAIDHSTFAQNMARYGGAIDNNGQLSLKNTTIAENTASEADGGGGLYLNGSTELINTLIAKNTPNQIMDFGSVSHTRGILIDDGTLGSLLAPLANYGGFSTASGETILTYALLPGSTAIDLGAPLYCTGYDQREKSNFGPCDIGAFESQGFSLSVASGEPQTAWVNEVFTDPLIVNVTSNDALEPVDGGLVSFAAPTSGASAILSDSSVTIDSSGAASVTATANGTSGPYSVNAAASGATSDAIFDLINQPPPTLTTLAAGNVTATSATLNATANASGIDTTVSFEYGLEPTYGSSVNAVPNLVSGSTDTPVSAALSGLTTHTTYHFRAVANNPGGTVYGADQTFTPQPSDFGDLPESYGTSLSANGPYHRMSSSPVLYLGATIDAEEDGVPSTGASSDDLTNLDDEDGVSLINPESWLPGVPAQLSVTSSASGFLNAWIDFNQNGAFDISERILTDQPISSGINTLTFMVPSGATATISTGLPARFRVASIPGIVNPTGPAVDGEVVDTIFRNQTLSINDGTLDEGDSTTSTLTFTVSLSVPAPAGGVTFDIATADGTATIADGDYSAKSLTGQSIPAGSSSYTFEVSVQCDTAPEADETFQVNITNVTSATITDGQGTGTITNDDWVGSFVTTIHNGSVHTPIDAANLNDSLHASVSITGSGPAVSGSVDLIAYANPYCGGSGTPAGSLTLDSSGAADPSTSFPLTSEGLSFRAHYNGDTNYPAADGLCTPISTSTYPTVLALSANANPKDGDQLTASPANLIVQFNRDVLHGDSADADSADNPDNYLLVEAGSNETFDTTACGGTLGGLQQDDTPVTINAITYDPATFTAAITYNGGAPLPEGHYLLFICGTTSISDPTRTIYLNNELDDSRVRFDIQTPDPVTQTVKVLPATGFAPNQLTFLPFQPVDKRYTAQSVELEIPSLGVKQAIVGVPGPEWNVSWLGNQIGYLQGTAFPTWNGNSVLAAHATNALGKAGPFASLGKLAWGKQIIIHAWGQNYIYEVRSVNLWTSPNATDALSQHEELPWLTLITCHGYDEKTNTYRWRTVVRAVLVEVE